MNETTMNGHAHAAVNRLSLGGEVARCEVGPRKDTHPYILRLKGGTGFNFHCYSPNFWGFNIHWCGDHSEPHYSDKSICPGCEREAPLKERFYLFCWCVEKKQFVFLEFTAAAARALDALLPPKQSKRGLGLYVTRTKADNGRINVQLLGGRLDESTMAPDRDPVEALKALWRVKEGGKLGGREFPAARRNSVFDTE